jgi:hypothetical protein
MNPAPRLCLRHATQQHHTLDCGRIAAFPADQRDALGVKPAFCCSAEIVEIPATTRLQVHHPGMSDARPLAPSLRHALGAIGHVMPPKNRAGLIRELFGFEIADLKTPGGRIVDGHGWMVMVWPQPSGAYRRPDRQRYLYFAKMSP